MPSVSVNLNQSTGYLHDGGEPGDMSDEMQRPVYVVVRTVNTVDYPIGKVYEKVDVSRMIEKGVTVSITGEGRRKLQ